MNNKNFIDDFMFAINASKAHSFYFINPNDNHAMAEATIIIIILLLNNGHSAYNSSILHTKKSIDH